MVKNNEKTSLRHIFYYLKPKNIAIYLFITALFIACSAKNDTWLASKWQKVPTQYNVLYNGYLALEQGKKQVYSSHKDNYFDILPTDPVSFDQDLKLNGEENPDFNKAEEKAVAAIQKHSMLFDGVQKNDKIDDAYILLGQARYYNKRYVPALEAFNHLLTNYGKTDKRGQAIVWKGKTNLRLNQENTAISSLQEFLNSSTEKLKNNDLSDIKATIAQAYINIKDYDNAVSWLKQAISVTKNKKTKGRYLFIVAQLYEKLGVKDSAYSYFNKVSLLNRKVDRELWLQAQGGIARNQSFDKQKTQQFLAFLKKMETQYENKNMLGLLYFQHALTLQNIPNPQKAIAYYGLSLKENKQDNPLKEKTHKALAELYFAQKDYVSSHSHYDSTLVFIPQNTLERLYIQRKRDNISQVAQEEIVVKHADSIINIYNMSPQKRTEYFTKMADSLNQLGQSIRQKSSPKPQSFLPNAKSDFYFYNSTALAYGKQQFQKIFQNRPLSDNWRWSSIQKNPQNTQKDIVQNSQTQKIDAHFFEKDLPSQKQIDSISQQKNDALYRLGLLYSEKFAEYDLALDKFQKILNSKSPISPELNEKVLYQLYNVSDKAGRKQDAQNYKQLLLSSHPNSSFASILQGHIPDSSTLDQKYHEAEQFFNSQEYSYALSAIEQNEQNYITTSNAYKWKLLKAKIIGRLQGLEAYMHTLEDFLKEYKNTPAGEEVIATLHKIATEKPIFAPDEQARSWKVVYPWNDSLDLQKVKTLLDQNGLALISFSKDIYTKGEFWLVFHGAITKQQATLLDSVLSKELALQKIMLISSQNYSVVQLWKLKDDYNKTKK